MSRSRGSGQVSSALVATVVLITAIAPLATDMYVPGFPAVARDLGASASEVQLTLTTFFVGMGLGQIIGGPVSDQVGRRRLLLGAVVGTLLGSVGCALAPDTATMMIARFVQGFAGGWAMVIGRAVVIDLVSGAQLVRVLNVVAGVGGIAPIVAPLLGAFIIQLAGWRMSFWAIAGIAVGTLVCVALAVPESLPPERRHGGGLTTFRVSAAEVLGNRRYVGYVVVTVASFVALFAYVATSAFILQSMNGLSPTAYAVDFAANAGAMTVAALVSARLAGRVSTRRVIAVGQVLVLGAGLAMLVAALWLDTSLWVVLGAFLALMTAQGLIIANAGALASHAVPDHPGTGSAVLGMLQWAAAGLAAPIAGLGGSETAIPMAVLTTLGAVVSIGGLVLAGRSGRDSDVSASPVR